MDFPKKQQQCLIPRYLLQYLQDLQISHTDPTAPWGGGGGGSYTAGDGIEISDEDVISIDNTVALKTDIPSLTGYATQSYVTSQLTNYVTTNTEQNITKVKTIYNTSNGHSDIYFKAPLNDNVSNTMGFSAFDSSNRQIGGLQIMNRTLQFNSDESSTYYYGTFLTNFRNNTNALNTVTGFRVLPSNRTSGSYSINFVAPIGTQTDLYNIYKSNSNVNTVNLVAAVTDGTNTVLANKLGVVDISSLVSGGGTTYTAGDGIDITNDTISIDNTVALKSEIPTVPTNVSSFTNDSGYITSSALTNYVTTDTAQEITGAKVFKGSYRITCQSTANEGASVAFKASSQSSSQYPIGVMEIDERLKVMKFSVNGVVGPDYVPALGYFGGTVNYDYVAKLPKGSNKYSSISSGDVYLPLSVNKTKADSSGNISLNIPTNTSDLNNDSGYITSSALTGYATETWVTNQGYLVSSDLADYITSTALATELLDYAELSDLATVATTGDYDDLSNKPDLSVYELAADAFSGDYNDLTNKPTIPDAVSGTNDGTNWTSLTIGSDTYSIPAGGSSSGPTVTRYTGYANYPYTYYTSSGTSVEHSIHISSSTLSGFLNLEDTNPGDLLYISVTEQYSYNTSINYRNFLFSVAVPIIPNSASSIYTTKYEYGANNKWMFCRLTNSNSITQETNPTLIIKAGQTYADMIDMQLVTASGYSGNHIYTIDYITHIAF